MTNQKYKSESKDKPSSPATKQESKGLAKISQWVPLDRSGEPIIGMTGIRIDFERPIPKNLVEAPFLIMEVESTSTIKFKCPDFVYQEALKTMQIGQRTFTKFLLDVIPKGTTNPIEYLSVTAKATEMKVPQNFDSAADLGAHKIIQICDSLNIRVTKAEELTAFPHQVSSGTERNLNLALDYLKQISYALRDKNPKQKLSLKSKSELNQLLTRIMIYKWASANLMLGFLDQKYDPKFVSMLYWQDRVETWGTPIQGNILKRLSSFVYEMMTVLASHDYFSHLLPDFLFRNSGSMRHFLCPSFAKITKKGKGRAKTEETVVYTVDIFHPENARWMFPEEKSNVKNFIRNRQSNLCLERLDNCEGHLRTYEMYSAAQMEINKQAKLCRFIYSRIKRLARARMFALKTAANKIGHTAMLQDVDFKDTRLRDRICQSTEVYKTLDQDSRDRIETIITETFVSQLADEIILEKQEDSKAA